MKEFISRFLSHFGDTLRPKNCLILTIISDILPIRTEEKRNMKKNYSPTHLFFKGFLKSIFIIGFFLLVGFGSYSLTMFYYSFEGVPTSSRASKLIREMVSDGSVDEVSKNLIFSVDNETGEIKELVIEIVNTFTNNIDYITVPTNTQFTLSNELYQKIFAVNSEIPQIIQLSRLKEYFDEDYVYVYGILMVEDLLEVDISYYTSMSKDYFNTIFEDDGNREVLLEEYKNMVASINTEEAAKEYIKKYYKEITSNLSIRNKQSYINTYLQVDPEYIYFHSLIGEQRSNSFIVDTDASSQMIAEIISNDNTYSKRWDEKIMQQTLISSKESSIQILNGSNITGLAAEFQSKLTEEGYHIIGIGNYNDTPIATTKIIVNSNGLGQDLADYFYEPMIMTEELPEGIDIQIIIGTADKTN